MTDNQTPESEDSLQEYINLRYEITDPIEAFNLFIKRNLPELYAHFIDNDDNEAEYVRRIITASTQASNKALLERLKAKLAATVVHPNDIAAVQDAIGWELAALERQQLGKESSDE